MNLLTEDEAKAKWCPLVRAGREAGCNRSEVDFGATAYCIASACMAWRKTGDYAAQVVVFSNVSAWEASGWKVIERLEDNKVRMAHPLSGAGFCGAFGRPDLGGQS